MDLFAENLLKTEKGGKEKKVRELLTILRSL